MDHLSIELTNNSVQHRGELHRAEKTTVFHDVNSMFLRLLGLFDVLVQSMYELYIFNLPLFNHASLYVCLLVRIFKIYM